MLTCIYHPIDGMQVVEQDEADSLLASGFWFDSPLKAREYREQMEKEIKEEKALKPRVKRSKDNEGQ